MRFLFVFYICMIVYMYLGMYEWYVYVYLCIVKVSKLTCSTSVNCVKLFLLLLFLFFLSVIGSHYLQGFSSRYTVYVSQNASLLRLSTTNYTRIISSYFYTCTENNISLFNSVKIALLLSFILTNLYLVLSRFPTPTHTHTHTHTHTLTCFLIHRFDSHPIILCRPFDIK